MKGQELSKTFVENDPEKFEALRNELYERRMNRDSKAMRGKDVKRIPKPWTEREVVYTCSNGWTIEVVHHDDYWLEALFLGHCLAPGYKRDVWSLREEDGTPHATIYSSWGTTYCVGRCNAIPPEKYMNLILEWDSSILPESNNTKVDNDLTYHEKKVLDDRDWRDEDYWKYNSEQDTKWLSKRKAANATQ